jgi:hypothetical protein
LFDQRVLGLDLQLLTFNQVVVLLQFEVALFLILFETLDRITHAFHIIEALLKLFGLGFQTCFQIVYFVLQLAPLFFEFSFRTTYLII